MIRIQLLLHPSLLYVRILGLFEGPCLPKTQSWVGQCISMLNRVLKVEQGSYSLHFVPKKEYLEKSFRFSQHYRIFREEETVKKDLEYIKEEKCFGLLIHDTKRVTDQLWNNNHRLFDSPVREKIPP